MRLCFHPSKNKPCHNTVFPPAKLGISVAVKVILTCLFTASSMHNLHRTCKGKSGSYSPERSAYQESS